MMGGVHYICIYNIYISVLNIHIYAYMYKGS